MASTVAKRIYKYIRGTEYSRAASIDARTHTHRHSELLGHWRCNQLLGDWWTRMTTMA